ncbi:MAG TPA: 2-oxo-4-hydroxy-4-carboxy-5-ureidoimidazoline decarboxylase [Polyangiales bacterium]|nr:2-oxo-4-hydroxy-4-carboxy-5-ureidoimidazoline decarboxylase [Polyangiales bacterium]
MAEPHAVLNALDTRGAFQALQRCCGSHRWVEGMLRLRPFASTSTLMESADTVWRGLARADYLEAFAHHPAIGADVAKLREKFASTAGWSSQEQAGVQSANEDTLLALRDGNVEYRDKFGYVFLVCATGKSADEMLALLQARLPNAADDELRIAAAEHEKITRIRLAKLEDKP